MGVARDRVDHDPLAMQYVLALGDRDIMEQRNRLRLHNQIVDAEIPARRLILGNDRDAAARLDSANVLLKGKGTSGSNREAESTDAPERGGLPRSVCWVARELGGLKSLQRSDEGRCIQRQG